jgi:oxalate decarboxylase/phosphoglucose isomerase-like protein (cupin superfamily)
MLNRAFTVAFAFTLFVSPALYAQAANGVRNITPGPSHTKAITVIDRPEIKIQRVEIEPNATRGLHAHDDVIYHVFMTMDAPLVLKIEGEADVHLDAWQTHFFTGGTIHAITNTSAEPVRFLEVFVNKPAAGKTAAINPAEAEALARAFAK